MPRRSPLSLAAALSLLLVADTVLASDPEVPPAVPRDEAPRNYVNLRVGVATTSRLPVLGLEVAPLEFLSLEASGAGSEYRPASATASVSHYRVLLKLDSWKQKVGWLQPRVGFGFAEEQVGPDQGGFQFSGVGPDGVETAGPELSASLRWLVPIAGGFEAVGEVSATLAYFHYAPQLVHPQSKLEPGLGLTAGIGF